MTIHSGESNDRYFNIEKDGNLNERILVLTELISFLKDMQINSQHSVNSINSIASLFSSRLEHHDLNKKNEEDIDHKQYHQKLKSDSLSEISDINEIFESAKSGIILDGVLYTSDYDFTKSHIFRRLS